MDVVDSLLKMDYTYLPINMEILTKIFNIANKIKFDI